MDSLLESFDSGYLPDSYRIITTPSNIATSAFFYVQETGSLTNIADFSTKRENLDSLLCVIVLDGKGELFYKDNYFKLSKGCCFFIDCINPHLYKNQDGQQWKIMWVHFNGSTSRQYYEYFENNFINVIRPSTIKPFEDILRQITEINMKSSIINEVKTSELIVSLLTLLLTFKKSSSNLDKFNSQHLQLLKEYLDKNFTSEIYLQDLADKFKMSKFCLTREFKNTYGITISKYIMLKRIGYSKRLLRFTDKSIENISDICGFYDTSYFNKQFKSAEQQTPFKYRRCWREK